MKTKPKPPLTSEAFALRDRMSIKEIAQRLGVSERTVWRRAKDGDFPKIHRFGPNCVGVLVADYLRWVKNLPGVNTEAA